MSDNVSKLNTRRPHRAAKRVVVFVLLAVFVCAAVALYVFRDSLNLDAARRFVRYLDVRSAAEAERITFDAHSANQYADVNGSLAIASVSGLRVYTDQGEELSAVLASLTTPQVNCGGKFAMAYDAGGYCLVAAHASKGEVLSVSTTEPIFDADIASDGSICYVSSESGYKTVAYVYNDKQQMIYRWLSSSQFLPLCTVNSGAKTLACVSMGQSGGIYESSVVLLKTDSDQIEKTISLGNEMIYDLKFTDAATLCAVGESSVSFLTAEGARLGKYDYADAYLKDFTFGGSGFLTLTLNMYKAGNRYRVVTVGQDGEALGTLSTDAQILDVSAAGGYVAVLTAQQLTIYDQALNVYAEQENTAAATAVVMRDDGSAILLGSGQGVLFVP